LNPLRVQRISFASGCRLHATRSNFSRGVASGRGHAKLSENRPQMARMTQTEEEDFGKDVQAFLDNTAKSTGETPVSQGCIFYLRCLRHLRIFTY
jgi:hypothetical protein